MAGGLGTRFWPISRACKPKQFLDLSGSGKSFLQTTYDRFARFIPAENIIVITIDQHEALVKEQLPELPKENILLETYNRNTAPCLAYASITIKKRDPEAVMIAAPADHIIMDTEAFEKDVKTALDYAAQHKEIITLGIIPTRPDVNFGYIQLSSAESINSALPVKVKTFTEKPDKEMAEVLFKSGDFLWNSGMFISQASVIYDELNRYAPEITGLWDNSDDIHRIYTDCPRVSFDIAVMERTEIAMVLPAEFGWADIGNWDSLSEYMTTQDSKGNLTGVFGKKLLKDNTRSIVYSSKPGKLIAIKGMEDMIVIDTDDVLMICPRDQKKFNNFLSELAMPEYEKYR